MWLPAEPAGQRDEAVESVAGPGEFFESFFRRLEQRGIPYVLLNGYDGFPTRFLSDVDYAVLTEDLAKVGQLAAGMARERGWVVAKTVRHELFASYMVVIDPDNPANHLALDARSHVVRDGCVLVKDSTLVKGRRRNDRRFFVPAPASEFIYQLATALAKNKPIDKVVPRLRELWALDPGGAQRQFKELFGQTGHTAEDWRQLPAPEWPALKVRMRRATRYGPRLVVAELNRRRERAIRPAGLHIALLGPDGSGKSTVIERLERLLAPCFSRQTVFKFRPDVWHRITPGIDPTPHLRPPRPRSFSWAKVFYYFADWWIGVPSVLIPERRRGALVVFDRDFDDLLVDQRRYLVQGAGTLVRLLRRFVPRADATFVLDADPRTVHRRKPELPVDELERQRHAYRELAAGNARMHLVSADAPADQVARVVSKEIILLLADRERRRSRSLAKRALDLVLGASALVILSPLMFILALLVRLKLGAPVIFRQERPGRYGKLFTIYKFRTMTNAQYESGRPLPDAKRLTRFGQFLRSTSLDELPELANVVRGDMSLVGPRPLLIEYVPLYSPEQRRRHEVVPGITGWAQVHGRNNASWARKFELDVWYVDHQSFWLDLKILALTVSTVLKRKGISQPGRATGDKFRGEGTAAEART